MTEGGSERGREEGGGRQEREGVEEEKDKAK